MEPNDESPTHLRTTADSKNLGHASSVRGGKYRFQKGVGFGGGKRTSHRFAFARRA